MLQRYIRPYLGERVLASMRPMDVQTTFQKMIERGLSARTVRYTHAVSAADRKIRPALCSGKLVSLRLRLGRG